MSTDIVIGDPVGLGIFRIRLVVATLSSLSPPVVKPREQVTSSG